MSTTQNLQHVDVPAIWKGTSTGKHSLVLNLRHRSAMERMVELVQANINYLNQSHWPASYVQLTNADLQNGGINDASLAVLCIGMKLARADSRFRATLEVDPTSESGYRLLVFKKSQLLLTTGDTPCHQRKDGKS